MHNSQELSPHALYMRLKRLCERTGAGKLNVPAEIHQQWQEGCRDQLGLALVKALKQHGFDSAKKTRDAVRACELKRKGGLVVLNVMMCTDTVSISLFLKP